MSKRAKVSRKKSKRIFSNTASKPHPVNIRPAPMRGGIRM